MSHFDRYLEAVRVGEAFWRALAVDDDDALAPLLSPTWDDRPPGFAAIYRGERELARETCRFIGLVTAAELVASDRVRFRYAITDRILHFEAGASLTVWRLELVEVDGRWLVDRSTDDPAIEQIDLTPLFPALTPQSPGPIQ